MTLDSKVTNLVAAWEERNEQGIPISPETLCKDCPELIESVKKAIRDLENWQLFLRSGRLPSSDPTTANLPDIPGFEIQTKVGQGGMGVVYKALQVSLNRVVALKMIRSAKLASENEIRRFKAEADAAAKLDHPRIVAVHDEGEHDGQHYFSMAFIEGKSLQELVSERPLPPKEAVELVEKIAKAVSYAHGKGVIHRDLKPANILLDGSGDPRVTDFGLAKRIDTESDLTATDAIIGTASYMPPEQAQSRAAEIGPPSDVYALGAILYHCLTGGPPFQAPTRCETLRQVIEKKPDSPRHINPDVPEDLATICLKCLQKEPTKRKSTEKKDRNPVQRESTRRYATAEEFADDLGRFRKGEPIWCAPSESARAPLDVVQA